MEAYSGRGLNPGKGLTQGPTVWRLNLKEIESLENFDSDLASEREKWD